MMRRLILFVILLIGLVLPQSVQAQPTGIIVDESLEGKVIRIIDNKQVEVFEGTESFQVLDVLITSGSLEGETLRIDQSESFDSLIPDFQIGDEVMVQYTQAADGYELYYITDTVRRKQLYWLVGLFVLVVWFISREKGIFALMSMAYSFVVILKYIIPQILKGSDPVTTVVLGSVMIVPVTFYFTHGFNKKTNIAVGGTLITLLLTSLLAFRFVDLVKLTGFASEEAVFVQFLTQGEINIKGLLLAGIIIGTLGILDDITVSQASVVEELSKIKKLSFSSLYSKALNVGSDHIASLVNTLVLVYAGASLPLLILFVDSSRQFEQVINYEIVAEEIVRTMIGSIGLVLAVPITTLLAAYYYSTHKQIKKS